MVEIQWEDSIRITMAPFRQSVATYFVSTYYAPGSGLDTGEWGEGTAACLQGLAATDPDGIVEGRVSKRHFMSWVPPRMIFVCEHLRGGNGTVGEPPGAAAEGGGGAAEWMQLSAPTSILSISPQGAVCLWGLQLPDSVCLSFWKS